MQMIKYAKVLFAVSSVLALGVLLFVQDRQREERFLASESELMKGHAVDEIPAPIQRYHTDASHLQNPVPQVQGHSRVTDERRAALQVFDAYQNAADYRVLVESLLANPSDTSGFYVKRMLVTCAAIRNHAIDRLPPAVSSEQDDARQRWLARCSSFTDEELSLKHLGEILMDPRARGRFHEMTAHDELATAKLGPEARTRVRDAILAAEDPILLDTFGPDLFVELSGDMPEFEGKVYPQERAHQIIMTAWRSAVCEAMGLTCGKGDEYVQEVCAWHGVCANSRQELMRGSVQQYGSAEEVKLYDYFMGRFVTLIRNKGRSVVVH